MTGAHANPWTQLTTKEQIQGTRWGVFVHVYKSVKKTRQHSKFQQCENTKRSQIGIWTQMSKVSNTCIQGFVFHLPLSSLSGYFLCGGVAGHWTEVTITWGGSYFTRRLLSTLKALIIPYHKTPPRHVVMAAITHHNMCGWVTRLPLQDDKARPGCVAAEPGWLCFTCLEPMWFLLQWKSKESYFFLQLLSPLDSRRLDLSSRAH